MRRALLSVAVLLTVAVSPTFAGYLIIRVLLEGSGGGTSPGGPGPDSGTPLGPRPPAGGPRQGSGLGRPGGNYPGNNYYGNTGGGKPGDMGSEKADDVEFDHTRSVVAVIPLEGGLVRGHLDTTKNPHPEYNPDFRKFVVPYHGRRLLANLFVDSTSIQMYDDLVIKPAPNRTRITEMRDKYKEWLRAKNDPQLLYDAMILALESGVIRETIVAKDGSMAKDAMSLAKELMDVAAEKKLTLPRDVQRFVRTWETMATAVTSPAPQPSNAEDWRQKLDARNLRIDGHYALIYWDSPDAEVGRRIAQLNDNFDAFFLWHATVGVQLPVPEKPLLAILATQGSEVSRLRTILDGMETVPAQADAFYAPDHNIVVLSPERLDDVGRTFFRQTQQFFNKGLNRDEILAGKIPKIDPTGEKHSKAEDVARASTLAIVEKLVQEEAELAAVSREGSRQLLFTTGVLPNHVTLPNWLTQGAVNVFTRPRGPAYVTNDDDKPYMTVAFSTGYGVPNYVLHRYFRDLEQHKELNADHTKLLEHILTDAYFTGLKDAVDPDPLPPRKHKKPAAAVTGTGPMGMGPSGIGPGTPFLPGYGPGGSAGGSPKPGPGGAAMGVGPGSMTPGVFETTDTEDPVITQRRKRERLNIKSQATAWALYYYLMQARSAELKQYLAELNKLPRDLPIDGRTAYAAFVRAFKLSTTEGGPADPALMKKFAKDWWDYMHTVTMVGIDIPLVVPKAPEPMGTGPMGPMGPMGPRGPRGPGGGR